MANVIKDDKGTIVIFAHNDLPSVSNQPEIRWCSVMFRPDNFITLYGYSIAGIQLYVRYDTDSRVFIDQPPTTVQGIRDIIGQRPDAQENEKILTTLTDADVGKLSGLLEQAPIRAVESILSSSQPRTREEPKLIR